MGSESENPGCGRTRKCPGHLCNKTYTNSQNRNNVLMSFVHVSLFDRQRYTSSQRPICSSTASSSNTSSLLLACPYISEESVSASIVALSIRAENSKAASYLQQGAFRAQMRPHSPSSLLLAAVALSSLLLVSCQADEAEAMHRHSKGPQTCGPGTTERPVIPVKLASGTLFCLRMPRYLSNPSR